MTEDARRRLRAIEEFSDLGSGFNIAMQDLDIRGAGNLLGAEQSGFIADMGYETYQKILSEAMEELGVETGISVRQNQETYVEDCTLETDQPAHIPDDYIDISAEKIRIYKQLDALTDEREIDRLARQMADRFGPLPPQAEELLQVVALRRYGKRLGCEKIMLKQGRMFLYFVSNARSPFYQSEAFGRVIEYATTNVRRCNLREQNGKCSMVVTEVSTVGEAVNVLRVI